VTDAARVRLFATVLLSSVVSFRADGLIGLVPHKRGPKQAHKLTDEVMTFMVKDTPESTFVRPVELN